MILPFSTQFKDGTPTYFIQKIWVILMHLLPDGKEQCNQYNISYYKKFGNVWDCPMMDVHPKPHTIRQDAHDRWHEGSLIHPVVFNRSKNQFQFAPTMICKSTQKIEIIRTSDYLNETIVKVDDRKLSQGEIQQLAWNDGFANLIAFWLWFQDGFTGKIIHWTDLKY